MVSAVQSNRTQKKDGSLRTTLKLEKCVSRFDDYLILLEIPLCTVLFEEIFYLITKICRIFRKKHILYFPNLKKNHTK